LPWKAKKTEKQYFALFRNTRVQVKVLPTGKDNHSSPQHVLQRLRVFEDQYQLGEEDELWFMIDIDRWPPGVLAQVVKEAKEAGYGLAISNPCFEVWLLCHFLSPPDTVRGCGEIETLLRTTLGGSYNKARLDTSAFESLVEDAINRAEACDPDPRAPWPQEVGTGDEGHCGDDWNAAMTR
jgi:hypothetical protein